MQLIGDPLTVPAMAADPTAKPTRPTPDMAGLDPFEQFHKHKYFASLDGVRCLAIMGVLTAHAFLDFLNMEDWGRQGVPLFFVISGFLITSLLLRERSRNGQISLGSFYLRRSLRIFPLYYAVLALYVLIVLKQEGFNHPQGRTFFHNLPFFLTYTANWFMDTSQTETHFFHSWSLCIEEQFYLVWPVVIWLFGRKTLGPVISMAALLVFTLLVQPRVNAHTIDLGYFPNQVVKNLYPAIFMGSLLAYGLHYRPTFKLFWPILGQAWSLTAFFVLAGLLIAYRGEQLQQYWLQVAMVGIVGAACIRDQHPLRWLFANKAVVYIGTISYGMYMFNKICCHIVPMRVHDKNQLLFFILTAGLTITVATISYYTYERWFLRIKDRYRKVDAKPD